MALGRRRTRRLLGAALGPLSSPSPSRLSSRGFADYHAVWERDP